MRRLQLTTILLRVITLTFPAGITNAAVVYPLEVFTSDSSHYDYPNINLFVELSPQQDKVDFTFYNESLLKSSVARIYFDTDRFLDEIVAITEGPGTSFSQPAIPHNLPAGDTLDPPFVTTEGFSIGSNVPRPHNGVNAGQWVRITCDLTDGGSFEDVVNELNNGALRIGAHIIALPCGASQSAVTVPEPTTVALLGLGTLVLLIKRNA